MSDALDLVVAVISGCGPDSAATGLEALSAVGVADVRWEVGTSVPGFIVVVV